MSQSKTLVIEISSYWHAGTGRTSGSHVDSLVEKTASGLPLLNGRHNKGLIRDAVYRAEDWGWFDDLPALDTQGLSVTDWLFGSRNNSEDDTRFDTSSGQLIVSNATLTADEATILEDDKNVELRKKLYRHIFSTAIEHATGTAKEHSLRGIEVVIPLTLSAELECLDGQQADLVFQYLERAISLIDHVGGMRNRGLGRATLSLTD